MMKPSPWIASLLALFLFPALAWAKPAYNVVCENANECPEWVAGLAHAKGVCSSFLVAPNIIGTNLHCIPEDLRKEKVSCQDRIIVSFPKSGKFPEETFDCEEMLHVSPPISDKTLTPDFAFFRIKGSTKREYLEISKDGIADGAQITLFKVDPGSPGTVRKVVCPAVQNSLFNPYFREDKSPLVSLIPCPIIKGNSGSALIGADGKAHGIIFSIYDVKIPTDPTLSGPQVMGTASNGANFSCLNTFFLNYVQGEPEACLISIDEESQKRFFKGLLEQRNLKFQKEVNEKMRGILKEKTEAHQGRLFWELSSKQPDFDEGKTGLLLKAAIEAKCLQPLPPGVKPVVDVSAENENFKMFYGTDAVMRPLFRLENEKVLVNLEKNKLPQCAP
jgi:hypothetical protein